MKPTRKPADVIHRDALEGIVWWNAMAEQDRTAWMKIAGSAVPADAWAAYKRDRQQRFSGSDATPENR